MISKERIQADILDRALQRMLEGKAAPEDSLLGEQGAVSEIRPLLETAARIRGLYSAHSLSPEYVTASGTRLLRRIKTYDPKPARRESRTAVQGRRSWRRSWALAAVVAAAVAGLSGLGVTSVSAGALPGDALYPVKQGVEEISLTLSFSATGDLALLANYADERLEEVERLAATDREADLVQGLDNYDKTLNRLDDAVGQLPPDSASAQLEDIQTRLARHSETLLALRDQLPQQAQSGLDRAIEHSQKSQERVGKLQEHQEPEKIPPGQEKKSTKDAAGGNDPASPAEKGPDSGPDTDSARLTKTSEASKTPRLSKTPKPSKTPEPTKTPKPEETKKPPKDKTKE
ncbi:MAG: hypothetical protein JW748_04295 [Anaerolineales bacterium]|nr:hypothetical protein [Anaerolineales bacterium]